MMVAKPLRRGSARRDRGSVAVEFALLLPLLVLLIFGLIDFGRALNAQITLTQAAREGSRALALGEPDWQQQTIDAATGLGLTTSDVTAVADAQGVAGCSAPTSPGTDNAIVKVTYTFTFITPVGALFGPTTTLTAEGVMLCES